MVGTSTLLLLSTATATAATTQQGQWKIYRLPAYVRWLTQSSPLSLLFPVHTQMPVPRHPLFSYRPFAEEQEEEEQQDVALPLRHRLLLLQRGIVGIAGVATALVEENNGS